MLRFLLFTTGLVLSSTAAYYSVTGLAYVFSGAYVPVLIMGAGLEAANTDDDVMRVFIPGTAGTAGDDQRRICAIALGAGVQVRHLKPSIPTLEDVFARAIGEA